MMGRGSSNCMVKETIMTQKRVEESHEMAGTLAGRGCTRPRRKVLDVIFTVLSEQSLAK